MQAYEFNSIVEGGVIKIPEEYKEKISSPVKVIILSDGKSDTTKRKIFSAIKLNTKNYKFDREEANAR